MSAIVVLLGLRLVAGSVGPMKASLQLNSPTQEVRVAAGSTAQLTRSIEAPTPKIYSQQDSLSLRSIKEKRI
jgi:hypothetical protein